MHNELGNVGGNAVQAGYVHTVNIGQATAPTALSGLPADEGFAGRTAELAVLAEILAPGDTAIATIAGPPGAGKSTLAVQAARAALAAGEFPGGVLFTDLHGYDQTRRTEANAALGALLRGLGVRGEHIPDGQDERATLYRSVLADRRRTLVVADNCADTTQANPLRPGEPHRMLVTSRHTLPMPAARRVELGVLSPEESLAVLDLALQAADPTDDRITANPTAAAELATLCGHLPLALRITAHLLADQRIADLIETLTNASARLAELAFDSSIAVRAAFDTSYRQLPADQARLFRLLSLHEGPHIGREAAAALADQSAAITRRQLDGLRRAHLIQPADGTGRHRWHDLLHLYAAEQCAADEPAAQRDAAVERLIACYTAGAVAANAIVDPSLPTPTDSRFADVTAALAWFDLERPNVVATVAQAAATGADRSVVELARALFSYFDLNKYWTESIAVYRVALGAARRLGDRREEADTLVRLGVAYRGLRRHADALTELTTALALQEADDAVTGGALSALGTTYRDMHRTEDAEDHLDRALALYRGAGDGFGAAVALNILASVRRRTDRFDESIDLLDQALLLRREIGDRYGEAISLNSLASTYHAIGLTAKARTRYLEALEIKRRMGDRYGEAITLTGLGRLYRETGQYDDALYCLADALGVRHASGDRFGEAITLEELGNTNRDLDRPGEALDQYRRALAGYEQNRAPHDVERVTSKIARLTGEDC